MESAGVAGFRGGRRLCVMAFVVFIRRGLCGRSGLRRVMVMGRAAHAVAVGHIIGRTTGIEGQRRGEKREYDDDGLSATKHRREDNTAPAGHYTADRIFTLPERAPSPLS
jgi:hypothetical protein